MVNKRFASAEKGFSLVTAVFIPVRTKSVRLPQKALLKIMGKPVIEHLIDRVKSAKRHDFIVLCTTTNPEDEALVKLAQKNGIRYFRGSEKDILDRYMQAAIQNRVDFIVSVEADDILTDPEYMDRIVVAFEQTGADYITCEGLPFGAAPGGIKMAALKKVYELKEGMDTETGWKSYFTESGLFKVEYLKADEDLNRPEIRMSLDYPEDFEFFKAIYEKLYVPGRVFTLREILSLLKAHPEIVQLNQFRQKEYWEAYHRNSVKVQWKETSRE